jgi:signal transduction histidine kinase
MDQSAQRMAAMFDGLLQLNRAQSHVLQPQPVDLQALLLGMGSVCRLARKAEASSGVCLLRAHVAGRSSSAGAGFDAALANAVKFTRAMPLARIQVDVQRDGQGGCFISVADNGVGFEQARAGKLFGVFQRMHREAEFEGLGIGLALVRDICRRHGGEAEIQAQLNAGCQLQMHWPTCLP